MSRLPRHIILAWIAAIVICIVWVDQPLALWIESTQTDTSRLFGHWLEEVGKSHWVLGYCLVVALIAWRSRRDEAYNHMRLFGAVAVSGITANLIKVVACRPRPPMFIQHAATAWDVLGFQVDFMWNSFPSGHATTGLAIAVAGSAAYPRLKFVFWTVGIAIALGRIMLNVHYMSDVLAGSLLGTIAALWFAERLGRKPAA